MRTRPIYVREDQHDVAIRQLEMSGIPCGEAIVEREFEIHAIKIGYVQLYTPQLLCHPDGFPNLLNQEGDRVKRAWQDGLLRARRDLEGGQS